MDKKKSLLICVFILSFLVLAGCVDILKFDDGSITYESHPTRISYTIRYGYFVNSTGSGNYEIRYDCDIPEVLLPATFSYEIINDSYDHQIEKVVSNDMIRWNIVDKDSNNYILGVKADVFAQGFIVGDLSGDGALTIDEIKINHPEKVEQYCKAQWYNDTVYLDPNNMFIKNVAESVLSDSDTSNSFIVAKNLFAWLKENTIYKTHPGDYPLQPASKTFNDKAGDCDDLSVLYISLCRAVDIPARFIRGILIDYDNGKISAVPHAWAEVFVGENFGIGSWIPVECAGTAKGSNKIQTEIYQNFGVESVGHLRLFTEDGSNESLDIYMSGIGLTRYGNDITIKVEAFLEVTNYEILQQSQLYIDKNVYRSYK